MTEPTQPSLSAPALYGALAEIHRRPEPYERMTTADLWTDPHISAQMLTHHLDPNSDISSRNHAFIQKAVDWIVGRFGLERGLSVCDLGCGPGLYANRLAARGARVTGVDFAEGSIRHARDEAARLGLAVDYQVADYLAQPPAGPFDLVCLIYCDFCALNPDQRAVFLDHCRGLLAPGGHLLLDVFTPAFYDAFAETATCNHQPTGGFWTPGPHFVFENTFKYPEHTLTVGKYTILEEHRLRRVYTWLTCYDADRLAGVLAGHGLTLMECFADLAGAPHDPGAAQLAAVARLA